MIDIHSHILPGLDDGATNLSVSLNIASKAVEVGIKEMVATPHYIQGVYNNDRESILTAVKEFNVNLKKNCIPLKILPGAEVYIEPNLPSKVRRGQVLTLNDNKKYLLLELPMLGIPYYTEQVIFDLLIMGITPIIAHPERNKDIVANPRILQNFLKKGVLVQVTAASLLGYFGQDIQKISLNFVRLGWVHCIASDAHKNGKRLLSMRDWVDLDGSLINKETVDVLTRINPKKIIGGNDIEVSYINEYKEDKKVRKKGVLNKMLAYFIKN